MKKLLKGDGLEGKGPEGEEKKEGGGETVKFI